MLRYLIRSSPYAWISMRCLFGSQMTGALLSGTITMAEILIRRDSISDQPLQLLRLGETSLLLTGKDRFPIKPHFKNPARARDQCNLADAVLKSSQQLLGHPRRAQEPAALSAVFDFQARRHDPLFSSLIPSLYLKFANFEEPVKNERLRSVGRFRHSLGIAGQREPARRR